MATPKKINIDFTASGNALEYIKKLSQAETKLTASQKKIIKATTDQIKVDSQLNRQLADNFSTMQDIERLRVKETNATIKGNDAKRSSILENKKEANSKKLLFQDLKKDIIARSKAAIASKNLAKTQQILSVNAKVNKDKIAQLNKTLKRMGKGFKEAGLSASVLKKSFKRKCCCYGSCK